MGQVTGVMGEEHAASCEQDRVVSLALWPFDAATRDALLEQPNIAVLTAPRADGGGGMAMLLIHHPDADVALSTAREQVHALITDAGVEGEVVATSTIRLGALRRQLAVELPDALEEGHDPSELMACYMRLCQQEFVAV